MARSRFASPSSATSAAGKDACRPKREAIAARKPRKITFDTLEDVLDALGPKLEYTVGDDVAVELEPTELDDFISGRNL